MKFNLDEHVLADCRRELFGRNLLWVIGGAGSGKTTACRALSAKSGIPVYDMDAHIYGAYHKRFTRHRHPVNSAWRAAPNGLQWLLEMSWDRFEQFNRCALVEYLDLLAADLSNRDPNVPILIDGGVCNPSVLARVAPVHGIVCMRGPDRSSAEIWSEEGDRAAMKAQVLRLRSGEESWGRFLELDERITWTILEECQASGITTCVWDDGDSVDDVGDRLSDLFGLGGAR